MIRRFSERLLFLAFCFFYASAYYYAYIGYLNPVWDYFGFTLAPLTSDRTALGIVLLAITALCQRTKIRTPATLTIFLLFINVYIPCLVTSLLLTADSIERYGAILICLTAVFSVVGLALDDRQPQFSSAKLSPQLEHFVLFVWVLCVLVLVAAYYSVMRLAPLDDQSLVYEQRVAGTADNPILGYLQTFFSNIFNPTLLLIGLMRKRWLYILAGFGGGILIYSITAQRTVLLLPIILLIVFSLLRSHRIGEHAPLVIMGVLAIAMVLTTEMQDENLVAAGFALLLTFRTIAIPGLTVSQYEDLFSQLGHTYWSHVKGIDLLVQAPPFAVGDPLWPNLGYIVGERTYNNPIFNVNANLFAGDGVAAAGSVGVLVIGAVFLVWLKAVDRLARPWNPLFATVALLPPAISLTNGHFFTTMLSFGGFFWLLAFHYFKPDKHGRTYQ